MHLSMFWNDIFNLSFEKSKVKIYDIFSVKKLK